MCLHAQCFSSVVGPNGSGKSNVIDAMLFVFGKRAKQVRVQAHQRGTASALLSKVANIRPVVLQLRLNKVSELIHNSTNHRNLETARVSAYFQEIIDTVRAYIPCKANLQVSRT